MLLSEPSGKWRTGHDVAHAFRQSDYDQFSAGQPRAQPQGKKTGEIAEQTCNQQTKMARIGLEPRRNSVKTFEKLMIPIYTVMIRREGPVVDIGRAYTFHRLESNPLKSIAAEPLLTSRQIFKERNPLPQPASECENLAWDRLGFAV